MVTLKGFIEVPADELEAVIEALKTHIKLTLKEPGCVNFSVIQDNKMPTKFHVYEQFEHEEAFKNHQLTASNSDWGKISKNVKRNYQIL